MGGDCTELGEPEPQGRPGPDRDAVLVHPGGQPDGVGEVDAENGARGNPPAEQLPDSGQRGRALYASAASQVTVRWWAVSASPSPSRNSTGLAHCR